MKDDDDSDDDGDDDDIFFRPIVKKNLEARIHISQGRHPILDTLLSENEQYVPNDTDLKASDITHPTVPGERFDLTITLKLILQHANYFLP
jgi:hypothetical protein